jgi:23S rRNA (uracil1939-C5)-methyltransferase
MACSSINERYEIGLIRKTESSLEMFRSAGLLNGVQVTPPFASPQKLEYRCHAKLAIGPARSVVRDLQKEFGRFGIGLYQPGSHEIVPINHCPVHRIQIKRVMFDLENLLEESDLTPYNERNHSGDLRHIAIRAAHLTNELMLTFVVTREIKNDIKAIVARLKERGHLISSAQMNINTTKGNVIFGDVSEAVVGSATMRERICELDVELGPTSFFQINPWQADAMYRRIGDLAGRPSKDGVAWDLYCGIGSISLVLARQGFKVIGIEENPHAIANAERNANKNDVPSPYFMASKVEDAVMNVPAWSRNPNVIIANPSRRGMDPEARRVVRETLQSCKGSRFIYMSCEAETLARDLKDIIGAGVTLRQIEPYDMFPFTEKMEWLAVVTSN